MKHIDDASLPPGALNDCSLPAHGSVVDWLRPKRSFWFVKPRTVEQVPLRGSKPPKLLLDRSASFWRYFANLPR
ncbi:hypothetical protein ACVH9Z_19480 [Rhodococcus opacus]|uniref:hypothetical protein n=1 Tax=Rhodococcus opacus TaxID=37919 RepID=UPI000263B2E7|nr:hypothetical protein [Rhodococcus opacus]